MATERIKKDVLFYKVDGHFDDGLIFNIPAKLRDDKADSTYTDDLGNELQEHDKRKLRRANDQKLIIITRQQADEIELIREDLKPFLIAARVFKWIWKHIILVIISTVAIAAGVSWATGLVGG